MLFILYWPILYDFGSMLSSYGLHACASFFEVQQCDCVELTDVAFSNHALITSMVDLSMYLMVMNIQSIFIVTCASI